jgi:hypothetical protein
VKPQRAVLVISLLLLAGLCSSVYADMGGFHITWFHADLEIQPNAE